MRVSTFAEFTWDGDIVPKAGKNFSAVTARSPFVTDVMAKRFENMVERAHLLLVDQKIAKEWPGIVSKGSDVGFNARFKNDYAGLPFDEENKVVLIDHHKSIPDKLKKMASEMDIEEALLFADTELLKLMLMRGWVGSMVGAVLKPGAWLQKETFAEISERRASVEAQRFYVEMKNLLPMDLSEQACDLIDQSLMEVRDKIAKNLLVGPLRMNSNMDYFGYQRTDRMFTEKVANQKSTGALSGEAPVLIGEYVPKTANRY